MAVERQRQGLLAPELTAQAVRGSVVSLTLGGSHGFSSEPSERHLVRGGVCVSRCYWGKNRSVEQRHALRKTWGYFKLFNHW